VGIAWRRLGDAFLFHDAHYFFRRRLLLDNVRELVCQQSRARVGLDVEFAGVEVDVATVGKRLCLYAPA
jgi:hypothetical protein